MASGLGGLRGVGRNEDLHAGALQRRRQSRRTRSRASPCASAVAGRIGGLLEGVAGRRLRIEPESSPAAP